MVEVGGRWSVWVAERCEMRMGMSSSFLGYEGTNGERFSGGKGEATSMSWSAIVLGIQDAQVMFVDDDVTESLAVTVLRTALCISPYRSCSELITLSYLTKGY